MRHINIAYLLILVCTVKVIQAQECSTPLQWTPVQGNNNIEWEKFPTFSLPFTIVYEAPRFGDNKSLPLSRGFSHLATFSGNEGATLPPEKRAITWYHIATGSSSQPWAERNLESPWGNDISLYQNIWNNQIQGLANTFDDSRASGIPRYDLIALDVERMLDTDREILTIKNNGRVPESYRKLSDNQFVERYKRDMQKLYTLPLTQLRTRSGFPTNTKVGSYSDVMIRGSFNNWLSMTLNSWKDWTTDPNLVLHIMRDTLSGNVGGSFYKNIDFLTPSCYYYYHYDTSPFGKDYLAYLLFVIEANRAWSDKPIIPFVWLRYHDGFNPTVPFVPPFVAEATAIFPFFSGAKGLWLWDGPVGNRQDNYATYEYFIAALHRLSQFKSFFEGSYELVIPQPAVEFAKNKSAIWRGVVKNNEILIAAQNPYATSDTQISEVVLNYKNWQKTISLKGREVFLCKFNLDALTANQPNSLFDFQLSPNPATDLVNYTIKSQVVGQAQLEINTWAGQKVWSQTIDLTKGEIQNTLNINNLAVGLYSVRLIYENQQKTQKLLIMR